MCIKLCDHRSAGLGSLSSNTVLPYRMYDVYMVSLSYNNVTANHVLRSGPGSPLSCHCLTLKLAFLFYFNKEFWHPCSGHHSLSVIITQLHTGVLDICTKPTHDIRGPVPDCAWGVEWRPLCYFFHRRPACTWWGIDLILGVFSDRHGSDMSNAPRTRETWFKSPIIVQDTPSETSSTASQVRVIQV